MTLQQFKKANKAALAYLWGQQEGYANFDSFCFVKWQEDGNCTYEELKKV